MLDARKKIPASSIFFRRVNWRYRRRMPMADVFGFCPTLGEER
jgi:hypothetical protein